LLLVIYIVSQLSSTYFMSAGATMPKAQRYLLFALPIIFIPFIVNFPSGLMIYWLTTNLWTTGQGLVTRRMMPRPDLSAVKRSSRTPAKAPPPDSGNGGKQKGVPAKGDGSGAAVAGPPRRVRRKRSGGGKRK
jgi:YidC/Oxa1 family membrane protein insertase